MHLDRTWAERQLARGLLVGVTRRDQPENFQLPVGEPKPPRRFSTDTEELEQVLRNLPPCGFVSQRGR